MITRETSSRIPLLLVDDVYFDRENPQRVMSSVRIGGHPVEVILDFTRLDLGLIEYIKLPWLLGIHPPSQQAVIELMARIYNGESIQFPVDISDKVRHSSPPSPYETTSLEQQLALEADADKVQLNILSIEQIGSEPTRFTLKLDVDGKSSDLQVELYAGHQRIPIIRWLQGLNPNSLSAAQIYAIQRALISKCENR